MRIAWPLTINRQSLLPQLACVIALLVAGCAAGSKTTGPSTVTTAPAEPQPSAPFFNARSHLVEYPGPGRDEPPPEGLSEVKIGWFGPADPAHPTAGRMWCAAVMAVEEANRAGGYNGLPFRLVAAWAENPWAAGIGRVTKLVYEEKVWAIAGAPDGPSAHLVEQVVAKARLTFVSPVSTDKTANLVNVPWIFSCAPGDHLQAPVLARAVVSQAGDKGFVLISCTDHDSRLSTAELLARLKRLQSSPKRHLEFQPGSAEFTSQLQSVREAEPSAAVVMASAMDSARFVIALRRAGLNLPVFGSPALGTRVFVEQAGEFAEGAVFPLLWDQAAVGRPAEQFARRFARRFAAEPDYTAAYTYDAMNMLIAAVGKAGLNRARIRDAVRELSPFSGVTGTVTWDPAGQNDRPVSLGTIRSGRIMPADTER